jgi:hypothetical protein
MNVNASWIKLPHPPPGREQVNLVGIVGSNITGINVIITTEAMIPIMNRTFFLSLVYDWFVSKVLYATFVL